MESMLICEVCEEESLISEVHFVAFEETPAEPFAICDGCHSTRPDGIIDMPNQD
jgi:hypothetical protein